MSYTIIFALVLFIGANWYVFYRLWRLMPPSPAGRWVLISAIVIALACFFLYFIFAGKEKVPEWLVAGTYKVGTSWIFIFLYFILAFLLLDLVRLTGVVPMEWMKNGSWAGFVFLVAAVAGVMAAGNVVYHNKKRVALDIKLEKPMAVPLKIVAVSDLHLGYGIGRRELERWIDMINEEKPDAVIIAGDLIDTHTKPLYTQNMADALKGLKTRLGVFAAPGNHEYISGIEESEKFYGEAGIVLLRDEVILLDSLFYIAGRDDVSNKGRMNAPALLEGADRRKPVILVDHQPYNLEQAVEAGADIQLSGHTHRGQVWPISWITDAIYEKSRGYLKKSDTHYYISSGLGIWGGKFRIGTRSEYVVINISGK